MGSLYIVLKKIESLEWVTTSSFYSTELLTEMPEQQQQWQLQQTSVVTFCQSADYRN